jgi:pyruvate dehydrogenase E2 component (dihydrolipoamide acetyltransferase)
MAKEFKLPDLGEGIHEGEVLAVRVQVGQRIKEGDIILEVETDKAAVEIPSPYTGTVAEIRVKKGDTVKVGQVMMTFETAGSAAAAAAPAPAAGKPAAPVAAPPVAPAAGKGPVPASPATRRLARELGVELAAVPPTGPAGLVTAADVRAFAEGRKPAPAPSPPAPAAVAPAAAKAPAPAEPAPVAVELPDFARWGPVERVPFRSIRRATARQMSASWAQVPHVNSQELIDVTRLDAFRQKHKAEIAALGGRLTLTVFALKAVTAALKAHPRVNSSLDAAASEIVLKSYIHVGVAVNTDEGLLVPVVRDVDTKSIKELAVELHQLVQKANARKLALEELQGGSFTITNAGALGGWFFAPIINHPQVAILGLGQARLQPAVVPGKSGPAIAPRLMMPAVLCIDHRVLDGADAVRFLALFKQVMEDPDELLMSIA